MSDAYRKAAEQSEPSSWTPEPVKSFGRIESWKGNAITLAPGEEMPRVGDTVEVWDHIDRYAQCGRADVKRVEGRTAFLDEYANATTCFPLIGIGDELILERLQERCDAQANPIVLRCICGHHNIEVKRSVIARILEAASGKA